MSIVIGTLVEIFDALVFIVIFNLHVPDDRPVTVKLRRDFLTLQTSFVEVPIDSVAFRAAAPVGRSNDIDSPSISDVRVAGGTTDAGVSVTAVLTHWMAPGSLLLVPSAH